MVFHSPATAVGHVTAITVYVAAMDKLLPDLAALASVIWFGMQIMNQFNIYLKSRKVAVGPRGKQGPPGVDAYDAAPEVIERLQTIHDLVNSTAEELKKKIATIEYAKGLQAGQEGNK